MMKHVTLRDCLHFSDIIAPSVHCKEICYLSTHKLDCYYVQMWKKVKWTGDCWWNEMFNAETGQL